MSLSLGLAALAVTAGLHLLGAWRSGWCTQSEDFTGARHRLDMIRGVASVLAFWITGNTVLAAPEAVFRLGVMGWLGYSFLGTAALVAFGGVARRISWQWPGLATSADFFQRRFDRKNVWLYGASYLVYVFGVMITQAVAGALLLEAMLGIPYPFGVLLTFAISLVTPLSGGFRGLSHASLPQVAAMLLAVLVVPPLVYQSTSVPSVYAGLAARAPSALRVLSADGWLFLVAGTIMGIGEVLIDNVFWQRALAIRINRLRPAFVLSGLAWAFVPLALGTLSYVALAEGIRPPAPNLVAPWVALRHAGSVAAVLLMISAWVAVISTIGAELNAAAVVFLKPDGEADNVLRSARWLTGILGIAGAAISLIRAPSMLDLLLFLGVINAAYIAPILLGIWWPRMRANAAFAAVLGAVALGYWTHYARGPLLAILVSSATSAAICLIGSLPRPATPEAPRP